jgi:hypothetical protein
MEIQIGSTIIMHLLVASSFHGLKQTQVNVETGAMVGNCQLPTELDTIRWENEHFALYLIGAFNFREKKRISGRNYVLSLSLIKNKKTRKSRVR